MKTIVITAKYFVAISICLLVGLIAFGQNNTYVDSLLSQEVKIGEKVPDFTLYNMTNYKNDELRLSDLKGKAVMLDFWATWCVPCVANIPKMNELQEKYQEDIVIIGITFEKEDKVNPFLDDLREKFTIDYLISTSKADTEKPTNLFIKGYFPHRGLPHYVWIDKDGILRAITSVREVTEENIGKLINGTHLDVAFKDDFKGFRNQNYAISNEDGIKRSIVKDIFTLDTVALKEIRYHSMLTDKVEGKSFSSFNTKFNEVWRNKRIWANNTSALRLYQIAYAGNTEFEQVLAVPYNRMILEFENEENYKVLTRPREDTPVYSYDLIIPDRDRVKLFETMKEDLYRYFKVKGKIEERTMRCRAIILTDSSLLNEPSNREESKYSPLMIKLRNKPISVLVSQLNYYNQITGGIYIDKTNYNQNIDLDIIATLKNEDEVRTELRNFGLDLIEVEEKINVLVLTDSESL